jgi:RimJ/RimL family protein N-acetyltransferase
MSYTSGTEPVSIHSGVALFELEGRARLELGYRLVEDARGRGYAREASRALLGMAAESFQGEILAMIDPSNSPSQRVAAKLGFSFLKQALANRYFDNLYRLRVD